MTVAVIVVAAGSGTRLGLDVPKAFVRIGTASVLEHALHAVAGMNPVPRVIVVAPQGLQREASAVLERVLGQAAGADAGAGVGVAGADAGVSAGAAGAGVVVAGGATRQQSVAAGLAALDGAETVLVHDAARAFTPSAVFERVARAVEASGRGVIPVLPVTDTIKRADAEGVVRETVDRAELRAVQTPQGFPASELIAAYAAADRDVTDDAQLMADAGHEVDTVAGDELAFKITTPHDLERAEALLRERGGVVSAPEFRVGVGTDTHAFSDDPDAELWVACLPWPGERGLAGHSDGDPVAHAVVDALLSAAGAGDIGTVFGTSDPRFAGAHGAVFLAETRRLVEASGWRIGNVSVQLIGNRPRFAARKAEAEAAVGALLGAPVSITATTTDGLGFTGRGEGVAAIATALLTAAD